MHKFASLAVVSMLALAGAASADVVSTPIPNTPFDNTVAGSLNVTFNSPAPVRAFYALGDWSRVTATSSTWSNDYRHSLSDGTVGTALLSNGGVGNGNPFTYTSPGGATWSNNSPAGFMFGSSAGSYTANLRSGFGTGTVKIENGNFVALTDLIAPTVQNLTGAPTMTNRPTSLTAVSGAGTYAYSTFTFTAPVAGTYSISADYRSGTSVFDGYLYAYNGAFDAANPLTNLIGLDDDFTIGGNGLAGSAMFLNLAAGQSYTVVTTTFSSGPAPTNDYTVFVAGPVPTPGAAAVLGLGGLLAARRRRA